VAAPITSLNNERVRQVSALLRNAHRRARDNLLVAEGLRLVREALAAACPLSWVFYTAEWAADPRSADILGPLLQRQIPHWEVSSEIMRTLSDTETPQGILAVLPVPALPMPAGHGLTLIPDRLRDPGNLGTLLRTAWAAGVMRVLLPPGTVDFTNPKVVRAGMGAHFHLPIRSASWEEIRATIAGATTWLAEAAGGIPYDTVDWRTDCVLIIGGEAEGAGPEAQALAAGRHVYIPMASGVESLNAAIAAGVLLFEAARQRRTPWATPAAPLKIETS
jgi:TrmH family RNA methyltransferase